jgi:hypothetical protein
MSLRKVKIKIDKFQRRYPNYCISEFKLRPSTGAHVLSTWARCTLALKKLQDKD